MSKYAEQQQIPGTLVTVTSADTNENMDGNAFTIAFANEASTVVGVPANGGDATVSLEILAGSSCPVNLKEIVSTTGTIIIGY